MPALQNFCLQAAFAIIFNYMFQLTTFVVVLVMDEERKKSGRLDVLFCIKTEDEPKEPRNFWMKFFEGPYYRLVSKKACFYIVLAISFVLLGVAVVGVIYVPVGLNEQVSMTVDSDLYNYFTYEKKYIEVGPPSYIVLSGFDFNDETQLDYISALST